jgi:hypothetical protein
MVHNRTIKVIQRSKLRQVQLVLARGDLFDAPVEAIVSSEQTDLVLSRNPDTISGQVWARYGSAIQRELRGATNGHRLRAGTVLVTGPRLDGARDQV